MRYPEFLHKNGTIGFTAPSYGAAAEPYRSAFLLADDYFHRLGFRTVTGENVFKNDGIGISTDPESAGKELLDFYCSPDNDVLISVGGGECMCETISHVDFSKIREAKPKWYMGYSDNTNFTFLLPTLCDVAAVYGPCASQFGRKTVDPFVTDALNVLTGENLMVHSYDFWQKEDPRTPEEPLAPFAMTEPVMISAFNWDGMPVSGRFIGGCLDILQILCGTSYDRVEAFADRYQEDGIIWFLEACDLSLFGIRRALWQLKSAGWFKNVKAFLIGRPHLMIDLESTSVGALNQYNAVLDMLDEFDVPVIMDVDIGHLPPQMPMISGGFGTLFRCHGKIQIQYELK